MYIKYFNKRYKIIHIYIKTLKTRYVTLKLN